MNILFVGDVVGRPGRKILKSKLASLKKIHEIEFTIVNAENAAGGKGLNYEVAQELYRCGADVLTLGNHAWDNKDIFNFIDDDRYIVRAYNFTPGIPGRGYTTVTLRNGITLAVAQLCCRLFMAAVDCPFRRAEDLLEDIEEHPIKIIDLHGEATSEKVSMGWYLNGAVTAVIGTHTHIPTADERVLSGGTAYITDTGMTGAYDSVIGLEIESTTQQFISGIRQNHKIAKANIKISAVVIDVDELTGKARSIHRLWVSEND